MDMQCDSKDEKDGRTVGWYIRLGPIKNARPPPLPWGRGQCAKEYPVGVREVMVDWRGEGGSQVSVKQRRSILLSSTRFCRSSGLWYWGVMDVAERILRLARIRLWKGGPGLISMSPARRRRKMKSLQETWLVSLSFREDMVEALLRRKMDGILSRAWDTDGWGVGGFKKRDGQAHGGGWRVIRGQTSWNRVRVMTMNDRRNDKECQIGEQESGRRELGEWLLSGVGWRRQRPRNIVPVPSLKWKFMKNWLLVQVADILDLNEAKKSRNWYKTEVSRSDTVR